MLVFRIVDRSTITRVGADAEDYFFFMSSSYRLHVVFICFVPNPGKRIIILGVSVAMHQRHDSTTPDHGIRRLGKGTDGQESMVVQIAMQVLRTYSYYSLPAGIY